MGTCIQQGDQFYSAGLHNNQVDWGQRPERRLAVGIQHRTMKLTGVIETR